MVKVFQTKFGGPDKDAAEVGNCYVACLATLTGKPIEFFPVMPPNVDETEENREAYDKALSDKLAEAGFVFVKLNLDADSRDLIREKKILTGFPYIMSGTSPRGYWLHAVIFQDGEMLHDPHPSNDGIVNWRFQELLVPVSPWLVDSQAQKIKDLESKVVGLQVAFDIEVTETESLRQKIAEQAKEPKLHCDICNRCTGDNWISWCSVNGRRIDNVLECPPWCIERGADRKKET